LSSLPLQQGVKVATELEKNERQKTGPSGIFGLLARLRDSGAIARIPGGWAKVFLALYSRRNDKGFAWPSQATLARDAGVSEHTVRAFLRWAKVAVGVKVTRNKYNSYYLPLNIEIDLWQRAIPPRQKRKPRKPENRTGEAPQRTTR
jgi:hypothetical protein